MGTLFNSGVDGGSGETHEAPASAFEHVDGPGRGRVDSNAVRWLVAATFAFWLAVYAVGQGFF